MIVSATIRDPNGQEREEEKVVDIETRQDLFVLPQADDTAVLMRKLFLDEEGRRMVELKKPLSFESEKNSLSLWDVDRKELVRTITLDQPSYIFLWIHFIQTVACTVRAGLTCSVSGTPRPVEKCGRLTVVFQDPDVQLHGQHLMKIDQLGSSPSDAATQ